MKSTAKQRCLEAPLTCCALLSRKRASKQGKSEARVTVRLTSVFLIFCTLALRFTLLSLSLSFLVPGFPLLLPSFLYSLFLRNADPSTITRYDTDPDSKRYGLDVKEAGKRFYICDADGLITKVSNVLVKWHAEIS